MERHQGLQNGDLMMIVKKQIPLAGPRDRFCGNCRWGDPKLHVCCAKDMVLTDEDLASYSCGDWEPKHICITCGRFDPDTNGCWWFGEQDMSEESMTKPCESWEPKKEGSLHLVGVTISKAGIITGETIGMDPVNPVEVPLQPDGSLKMQASETIGAETVNTDAVVRLQKLCDEAEPCKAKLTFQYQEKEKSTGWDHRLEAKALDRGAKQGMTQEALDTVFAIACQQVPSMEERWMELKAEISIMFAQKWAAEETSK